VTSSQSAQSSSWQKVLFLSQRRASVGRKFCFPVSAEQQLAESFVSQSAQSSSWQKVLLLSQRKAAVGRKFCFPVGNECYLGATVSFSIFCKMAHIINFLETNAKKQFSPAKHMLCWKLHHLEIY
jgi:hypothetical protein